MENLSQCLRDDYPEVAMSQDIQEEHIYFSPIKEKREGYFVTYHPGNELASLGLTFVEDIPPQQKIKELMLRELRFWVNKYPIFTMVHAYDNTESSIDIGDFFETALSGWIDDKSRKFRYTWKIHKVPKIDKKKQMQN